MKRLPLYVIAGCLTLVLLLSSSSPDKREAKARGKGDDKLNKVLHEIISKL